MPPPGGIWRRAAGGWCASWRPGTCRKWRVDLFTRGAFITADPTRPEPTLEFALAPGELKRLLASKTLAAHRNGPCRSSRFATVWHDTAAGALRARGLSLAEQSGAWRLERLRPNGQADWPPATASPVLAQGATPHSLIEAPEDELLPVAAFHGTSRRFALLFGNAAAGLNVLHGALRGIAREQPACRVQFLDTPVAFATELAVEAGLTIPRSGLAAEALSVATGIAAAPRRLGAPEIPPGITVAESLRRLTGHLADVILYWAPLAPGGEAPEPVHQMRVAVRRLRAGLWLHRRAAGGPAMRDLADDLRRLAATLGAARDWDVFLADTGQAVRLALPGERRVEAMLAAAARRRTLAYKTLRDYFASESWRLLSIRLAMLPTARPWLVAENEAQAETLALPIETFAAAALSHADRRLRQAGDGFDTLPPDSLHVVRKQAKKLRYATEFFAPLFPNKRVGRFLERLQELQEGLGTVNDGHVAAGLMAQLGPGADRAFAAGVVQGYVASLGGKAASRAAKAWSRYTRQETFWP